MTTTGVSASIPVSLALVETLAGRPRAQTVALELGQAHWDDAHPGQDFQLGPRHIYTATRNATAFWRHETLQARLTAGTDDLRLALTADAYARSYRTSVVGVASEPGPVRLASGLAYLPDQVSSADMPSLPMDNTLAPTPTPLLDGILRGMSARYGRATAGFVALQLEYPMREP